MSGFGKVAVLMGGPSSEREISLLSGKAVLAALQARGVDAHAFDPAERPLAALSAEGFKRVFIALHGRYGEDGTVQGTGSGVMASALAMDKWRTKMIWLQVGLPTPRYLVLTAEADWKQVAREIGLPLIVKPAREGSTIGISKVTRLEDLSKAYDDAARHDPLVLAEQFIEGREVTVSILGGRALPVIRIEAPGGNYDYQNKYFSDETRYFCPSGLPSELEKGIQTISLEAFRLLDCRGWGRADLMIDAAGKPWLLEMNTSPGMTAHSLVPMAAREAGLSFEDLVMAILESAHVG